jgi:DnaJ-class molecular chaperone
MTNSLVTCPDCCGTGLESEFVFLGMVRVVSICQACNGERLVDIEHPRVIYALEQMHLQSAAEQKSKAAQSPGWPARNQRRPA